MCLDYRIFWIRLIKIIRIKRIISYFDLAHFSGFSGDYKGCTAPVTGAVDSILHPPTQHLPGGGLPIRCWNESDGHHPGYFPPPLLLHGSANRDAD